MKFHRSSPRQGHCTLLKLQDKDESVDYQSLKFIALHLQWIAITTYFNVYFLSRKCQLLLFIAITWPEILIYLAALTHALAFKSRLSHFKSICVFWIWYVASYTSYLPLKFRVGKMPGFLSPGPLIHTASLVKTLFIPVHILQCLCDTNIQNALRRLCYSLVEET